MKLGIILITWASIVTILSSVCLGITLITWYNESLLTTLGFWAGLWLAIGGLPLYLGIKKVKRESQKE